MNSIVCLVWNLKVTLRFCPAVEFSRGQEVSRILWWLFSAVKNAIESETESLWSIHHHAEHPTAMLQGRLVDLTVVIPGHPIADWWHIWLHLTIDHDPDPLGTAEITRQCPIIQRHLHAPEGFLMLAEALPSRPEQFYKGSGSNAPIPVPPKRKEFKVQKQGQCSLQLLDLTLLCSPITSRHDLWMLASRNYESKPHFMN